MISLSELQHRRQLLLNKMVAGSAMILFAAPEVYRSTDTEYPYRQDSYFWYLTEFAEPEAALLLIHSSEGQYSSIFFNRRTDITAEIWFGRRLGQEAALAKLGVDRALCFDDVTTHLPLLLAGLNVIYHAQNIYQYADNLMSSTLNQLRHGKHQYSQLPLTVTDWRPLLDEMRLIKSTEEVQVIRSAADITAKAHHRAMKKCRPGLFEYQLEGEIQYEFICHGARHPAYSSIVGAGENSCILHYTANNSELLDGQLVLIDAGCEYQGYAADVTRTFPVNGKFSPSQRAIYDIVLEAQRQALKILKPGSSIYQANNQVIRVMVEGLINLGILEGNIEELITNKEYRQFYMHSLGHWLGLDVHDVGNYQSTRRDRLLEPGMVLTVEPGLYISSNENVSSDYAGIGIRIEDDILITETGNEVLTLAVVKDPDEIEAFMAAID